jgi:hemerythrin superfamily protein
VSDTTPTAGDDDVVDLLLTQHQEVRRLFTLVEGSDPSARKDNFDALRRLLAVHETAEEQFVHPAARRADGIDAVVDARLAEENQAKQLLAQLEDLDATTVQFMTMFGQLRTAVTAHAEHEEQEEFPVLRERLSPEMRSSLATAVKAAERLAPTHPHPGVESPAENVLVGPFASMVDRARDAMRAAMPNRD